MKKHLRKIGVSTLCLFLMFSFLSGFLLSIHTAWAASERQAAPATETTVPQTDSKDAQGAFPKDDQGNYIVGNSGEGVVTLSANPEYLKTVPLGDHKKPMIITYAAGWDDGVIYSSDFASPDGTDIITTTTPIIRISDNGVDGIAYCADPTLNIPSETTGPNIPITYIRDSANVQSYRIRNVMYHGYHDGQSGEYYVQTWAAIRVIAGISSYSSYYMTDPVVADLVNTKSYQDPPNWNASWNIVAEREEATWNRANQRQETGWFQTVCSNISEHGQYTVNLPQGVHAIARNTSGQTYGDYTGSFTIYDDDDFMLYADGSYSGDVSATITPTTAKRFSTDASIPDACVIYYPDVPNTQRLFVSLAVGSGNMSASYKATFKGKNVYSQFTKTDEETLDGLQNAHLQIYNKDTDELVAEADTDELGRFHVELFPGDYYIKETKAPHDHILSTDPIYFTVTGTEDAMTMDVPNAAKKVEFSFEKVDENGQAMPGVEFELYACKYDKAYSDQTGIKPGESDKHSHSELAGADDSCWTTVIKTLTSDTEGIVNFGELRSGEYNLVEVKTKAGYQLPKGQWRVTIDAEANTIDIKAKGKPLAPAVMKTATGLQLVNYPNPQMPYAGTNDSNRLLFSLLGALLLGMAFVAGYKKFEERGKK